MIRLAATEWPRVARHMCHKLIVILLLFGFASALSVVEAAGADQAAAAPRLNLDSAVSSASEDEPLQLRRRMRERRHGRPYGTGFEARREALERIERSEIPERSERPERLDRGGQGR